jgi:hypothetical protein
MDTLNRHFEFGSLGEENVIRITVHIGFSEDLTSVSFRIKKLPASKKHQIGIGTQFTNINGIRTTPYLIEFSPLGMYIMHYSHYVHSFLKLRHTALFLSVNKY